jgi:hypothetical protein
METGLVISLGAIVLLAFFAPRIRRTYLKARNDMREAAMKRRSKG